MKKLLLLIPVIVVAGVGAYWTTIPKTPADIPKMALSPQALFLTSEHDLRQIIRHGDPKAIVLLQTSLETLDLNVKEQGTHGFPVEKLQQMLHTYQQDSRLLSETFAPALSQVHQYDHFENDHEQEFYASIEQIGLYELKTAYTNLNSLRKDYLKEPSDEKKMMYEGHIKRTRQMINELYLDTAIEKPLYQYLDNHKRYFNAISTAYSVIGYDRINRLRTNGYAIKAELQILPAS